jgi:hypothetical protein
MEKEEQEQKEAEEEIEWESQIAENILKLRENGGNKAKSIVITGTFVHKTQTKILISGNCLGDLTASVVTRYYDIAKNKFKLGPHMRGWRYKHASVMLPTGDIALFGGYSRQTHVRHSCELLDVKTNTFLSIPSMNIPRGGLSAVLLPNGLVFIVGGVTAGHVTNTCEIYNPVDKTYTFSNATLQTPRQGHTASLLPDGKVLVCGGAYDSWWVTMDASGMFGTEIYDPVTDSFSAGPYMRTQRRYHTATTLQDGRILIVGGDRQCQTEIYDPTINVFLPGPPMITRREGHFAALLPDGRVFVSGGNMPTRPAPMRKTTDIYDPVTNSFVVGKPPFATINYASAALI